MKTRVVSAWDSAVAVTRRAARLRSSRISRTRREQALRNAQKYRPNISADPAALRPRAAGSSHPGRTRYCSSARGGRRVVRHRR